MSRLTVQSSVGSEDIYDLEHGDMQVLIQTELASFWNNVARSDLEELLRRIEKSLQFQNKPDRVQEVYYASTNGETKSLSIVSAEQRSDGDGTDAQVDHWPAVRSESKVSYVPQGFILQSSSREFVPCDDSPRQGARGTSLSDEVRPLLRVQANDDIELLEPHGALQRWCLRLQHFVVSLKFDLIVAVLITINTCSVGIQVNLQAQGWRVDQLRWLNILNRSMYTAFYVELGLRAYAYQPTFYKYAKRNILDVAAIAFIFASDICALIGRLHGWSWRLHHANAISVIRMLRNFRLLRLIRDPTIIRVFRNLRVFVAVFEDSLSSLGAAMVYIFLLNYGLAVILTATVGEYKLQNHDSGEEQFEDLPILQCFSNVPDSMLSLWEITLDGYVLGIHWGTLLSEFYHRRPLWVSIMFIGYVSVTKLGLLTIITGIFTTYAMRNAEEDNMFVLEAFAADFTHHADKDGDSQITWEEFRLHLSHPLIIEFFPYLAGDQKSAKRLFNMIDADGSGACSLHELLGILAKRSKGNVRLFKKEFA